MRFNHLILLVGANPLPNYVVAKYFLGKDTAKNIQKIWLICSEETYPIAGRICTQLTNKYKLKCQPQKIRINTPEEIRADFAKVLKEMAGEKVHLNYTGGTKMMAVHIHRIIKEKFNSPESFSYLSATDHMLRTDDGTPISEDLREEVAIDFEELIGIHNIIDQGKEKPDNAKIDNAVAKIKEEIQNNSRNSIIEDFKNSFDTLDKSDKPDKKKINPEKKEAKIKAFCNYALTQIEISNFQVSRTADLNPNETDKNWFYKDKWLEFYVYCIVKQNLDDKYPIKFNWELINQKAEAADKTFELDVVFLKNYQVCAISCTTAINEDVCKAKAFEVWHRAIQIGGDEAKAMLVCLLGCTETKKVKNDIHKDFGASNPIAIIGEKDLAPDDLWKAIENLIKGVVNG